jgi:LmbE family N-acetylglucosaminyl deacetylase
MLNVSRVLVLAPHTDDGEFGCGGTLAKLRERGAIIYYAAFSICEASVPEQFPPDILATEVQKAGRVLGIDQGHLLVYRYPVRHFPQYRQDILEELVRIHREIEPELIFVPSADDVHQDHQVVYQEGVRAFKQKSILGYELPWNNTTFTSSAFVHLEMTHIQKKLAALRQYESQSHRNYWNEDFITGLARVRGVQAGTDYAEAFQVIRWIVK